MTGPGGRSRVTVEGAGMRTFRRLTVVLVMALVAAACGGGDDDDAAPSGQTSAPAAINEASPYIG